MDKTKKTTIKRLSPYAGSCFFLAWMNGAFFTSSLSAFGNTLNETRAIPHWDLSLLGVFFGLVAFVFAERRFGELALKRNYINLCTSLVCAGTLCMLLDSSFSGTPWKIAGAMGAFATGFFGSVFYIAWTNAYSSLTAEESEIVIPFAVALGQLLAIIMCGFKGWLAILSILAAPVLSAACLQTCNKNQSEESQGDFKTKDTFKAAQNHTVSKTEKPKLLDWRCGIFTATIWFTLSTLTAMTKQSNTSSFTDTYLIPFFASFLVLVILLICYINFAKRLSLIEASRIVLPTMVISLVALVALPKKSAYAAFLIGRAGAMLFWTSIWICCANVVRSGKASATKTAGIVRGWIQGGAAFSILLHIFDLQVSVNEVALLFITLLTMVFAYALPHLMKADEDCNLEDSSSRFDFSTATNPSIASTFEARCCDLSKNYGLSPREKEVMECLLRGRNLPYIRETLHISKNTINTHIKHIYAKMMIHSKQELIDLYESKENESTQS